MAVIGYARCSTAEQNLDLQTDALTAAGADRTFSEHASGSNTDRPQLAAALDYCREGDTLLVWRLDRLGRSMPHLVATVAELKERGVKFRSLSDGIDTNGIGGELVFHIFAALAEFERGLIRERTSAGLQAARARGRVGGRPRKVTDAKVLRAKELHAAGQLNPSEIANALGVSVSTLYRYLNLNDSKEISTNER